MATPGFGIGKRRWNRQPYIHGGFRRINGPSQLAKALYQNIPALLVGGYDIREEGFGMVQGMDGAILNGGGKPVIQVCFERVQGFNDVLVAHGEPNTPTR